MLKYLLRLTLAAAVCMPPLVIGHLVWPTQFALSYAEFAFLAFSIVCVLAIFVHDYEYDGAESTADSDSLIQFPRADDDRDDMRDAA